MTREEALALVHEYTASEALRRHMYAVELGMRAMAERAGALAYLEAYAWDDDIEGDRGQFQRRRAAEYRTLFDEAGFVAVGMHCYVTAEMARELTRLETAR